MACTETEFCRRLHISLRVIEKHGLFRKYAEFIRHTSKDSRVRLATFSLERGHDAVKVIVKFPALLTEILRNILSPHDRIGVGEQIKLVIPTQTAQLFKTLHGNTGKKAVKRPVNLLIGDFTGYKGAHTVAKFLFGNLTFFQLGKRSFLSVVTKIITDTLHSKLTKSLLAILAADIHNHAAKIKQ